MNNKEFLLGFVGGAIAGGALVWAYMDRVTKIAFNNALKMNYDDAIQAKEEPEKKAEPEVERSSDSDAPKEDPPQKEEGGNDLIFIPNDRNETVAPGPTDKEPYIVTMEEADSDEVANYNHQILYYIPDDGVLMDSDGEEYTSVEDVGMGNLDVLGPDYEDIMVRNDETKTIYEVCVSMSLETGYPYGDEE